MHTYRETKPGEFTVGFHASGLDAFRPIRVFTNEPGAAAYTAFLNGGQPAAMFSALAKDDEPPADQTAPSGGGATG